MLQNHDNESFGVIWRFSQSFIIRDRCSIFTHKVESKRWCYWKCRGTKCNYQTQTATTSKKI